MAAPSVDASHQLLVAANQLGRAASGIGFWAGVMHERPERVRPGYLRDMAAALRTQADVVDTIAGAYESAEDFQ